MGQQHFRVSFSVGTKLLISVVSLLFLVIVFLDVSTIFLFTDDKRAYTYQSQSTEAFMAGRELTSTLRNVIDTLRIALANTGRGTRDAETLQSILANQSTLLSISIRKFPTEDMIARGEVKKAIESLGLTSEEVRLPDGSFTEKKDTLEKTGIAYFAINRVGKPPLIAVSLADRGKSAVVATGIFSLNGFGKELRSSVLTVTDREGWVLFSSDPEVLYATQSLKEDPLFNLAQQSAVAAGAQEFLLEDTRYLGSYVKPGLDIVVTSRTEWRKAMRATYALVERFVLLGCMAVGAAVIFAILFSKTLTAPLNRLYEATKIVAAGKFDVNLETKGTDEISALGSSFNVMSRKISELIVESMKKVQLENELAIASTVQQNLIPPAEFRNPNVSIQSHYQAAAECGGDWWGFFGVGNRMALMISDATGHGLPSALITAAARSCFSVMHKLAQEDPEFTFSPGAMLSYANRVVHDSASGKIMMTFFAGVLDFEKKTLTYASAGHNPPWLFKNQDGKFVLKSLTAVGQRLGEGRDVPDYEEHTVSFSEGDILFLYTDGVTEGKNLNGDMYGKKRLRKLVEANLSLGPDKVVSNLVSDFLKHNEGKQLDDDITLAAAKILKGGVST